MGRRWHNNLKFSKSPSFEFEAYSWEQNLRHPVQCSPYLHNLTPDKGPGIRSQDAVGRSSRYSNPNMSGPPPGRGGFMRNHGSMYQPRAGGWHASKAQQIMAAQNITYDGKRMRKAVYRKTVDYNSSVMTYLENRIWQRDSRDQRMLGTDPLYSVLMVPPPYLKSSPMNTVTTKFIRTSTNKIRCPIFSVCWTPEGRRLITGASSGEFTLWNGLTFNFETILQAHDSSVRSMVWSHNDLWMLTADHAGFIKYWQSNMNNVKMYQAHKDPVRGLSFCPTDSKFASCSDDGTVRIWDFMRCTEERILRGHGADVKCVDWHPTKSLLVSGSKDTQQPVKLWDARIGTSLATIHAHKHTVMEVKWNKNGNWLLTASRDHLLKLFDIRKMKEELQTFKGHKKEATTIAWHPIHESLFTSGGSDGAIMFWLVGHDKEVGSIDEAHETMVWSLAWHPLGHILSSGSNDHTTKFWTRNRVGDRMRDKYNLNTLPLGTSEDMLEYDNDFALPNIPGMGLEFGLPDHLTTSAAPPTPVISSNTETTGAIPGLGMDPHDHNAKKPVPVKKVPYAKPIPKNFEAAWESGAQPTTGPSDAPPTPNTAAPPPPSPGPGGWQGQGGPVMPGPYGQPPPRLPQGGGRGMQGSQQQGFRQPYQPRGPRPPPPTQQYSGYGQQGGSQQPSGGTDQWGGESWKQQSDSQNQGSYNSYGRGQSFSGSENGSYGGYNNNRGGTSNGAQGYRGADRGRGRGRGRGGPPPMGQQQPGSYHDPNQPPSLLDLPMQKRSWEKGPGEDGGGKDWSQGGEGQEDHPSKYSRGEGDAPQDSYQGGQSGGRPPYRGGRGGPPMRGGRGAPFRGRGGPPMRGRGRGGRW